MGADGGDDPVCAVYGRAGEPGDSGAVQGVSDTEGDGDGFPAGAGGVDPNDGVLSQQGEVDQGCRHHCWRTEFNGKVPERMEEILRLPGVARKTGNVVLGSWYGIAVGVVVDTHVLRLSRRLELTKNTTPEKVEQDLMKVIPQDRWIAFSHEVIHHGRQVCVARKPRCAECTLEKICNSGDKTWSSH